METKEDLGDDLCEYCSLNKKGVYGVNGGFVAGCEGSRCDDAYDNYCNDNEQYINTTMKTFEECCEYYNISPGESMRDNLIRQAAELYAEEKVREERENIVTLCKEHWTSFVNPTGMQKFIDIIIKRNANKK